MNIFPQLKIFIALVFLFAPRISTIAQPTDSLSSHVLDFSVGWGPSLGPTVGNYAEFLYRLGYAEQSGPYGPNGNPAGPESGVGLFASVQYFFTPRFALGAAIATLGDFAGNPARVDHDSPQNQYKRDYISEEHHSVGIYATASYLVPVALFDKLGATVKLTSGIGLNRERSVHSVHISEYIPAAARTYYWSDTWEEVENSFSLLFAAAPEFCITEAFSLGVNIVYRYVPRGTFAAHSFPNKLDDGTLHDTFSLPAFDPNLSDWNIGLCATVHLF